MNGPPLTPYRSHPFVLTCVLVCVMRGYHSMGAGVSLPVAHGAVNLSTARQHVNRM